MRPAIKEKIEQVNELSEELSSVDSVAIVSLERLPSNQLQLLRSDLGLELRVNSKNVLTRSLKKADKGFEKLIDHLKGSCALLLINDDLFKLSIKLDKNRRPTFIKPGMIAEDDIIIEEGPTPFMPGEMMTELSELGIKVSPKGGKITVMESSVIVKSGEVVSKEVAELLFKLNIKPVTSGLDLIAAFSDGHVFTADELIIDVDEVINQLLSAHSGAINLSFNANIINEFTIELLLSKGFSHAVNLARESGFLTKSNVSDVLLTAKLKALSLAGAIKWEVKE